MLQILDVLKHSRHDWLNKIQLIKGYISLGKIDQAERIIEEIIMESINETRLTNLQLPQFASYLMTFNWENHMFQLNYEILQEEAVKQELDGITLQWITDFFAEIDEAADPLFENSLNLTIDSSGNSLHFHLHYEGAFKDSSMLEEWLTVRQNESFLLKLEEFNHQQMIMTVTIDGNDEWSGK